MPIAGAKLQLAVPVATAVVDATGARFEHVPPEEEEIADPLAKKEIVPTGCEVPILSDTVAVTVTSVPALICSGLEGESADGASTRVVGSA